MSDQRHDPTTPEPCKSLCWISHHGVYAECSLDLGHEGSHWDHMEGWEW